MDYKIRNKLMELIRLDSEFLRSLNLMDYSFLVGIVKNNRKISVN